MQRNATLVESRGGMFETLDSTTMEFVPHWLAYHISNVSPAFLWQDITIDVEDFDGGDARGRSAVLLIDFGAGQRLPNLCISISIVVNPTATKISWQYRPFSQRL